MATQLSRRHFLVAAAAGPLVAGGVAPAAGAAPGVDAPRGLDVEWLPAPYERYGDAPGDFGNHDRAERPKAPQIRYILIHNTEEYWERTLELVQDPAYVAWNYSLRSSDGHIAQHLAPSDIGWHAGNWYFNMHSIGLEHEGFSAAGPRWFTEEMYRTSATLVRYLCRRYRIPKDRAHIIGHDQVPGKAWEYVPRMHADPGPFWDWERYFQLLGAPLRSGTSDRPIAAGDVIRILPGFVGNAQPVTGCGGKGSGSCEIANTNFVLLRVAPDAEADLINDPGLHQNGEPATTDLADIGPRATAGTEFVVATVRDGWVGIFYLGQVAWFASPAAAPTARVIARDVPQTVTPRGTEAAVFGLAYPEAAAYPVNADYVQRVDALRYRLRQGQRYVVTDPGPVTDYYRTGVFTTDPAADNVHVVGRDAYLQISFGHRIGFVRADDVVVG